jgi:hypothetical protein
MALGQMPGPTTTPETASAAPAVTADPYDIRNPDSKAKALTLYKDKLQAWSTPGRASQCRSAWRNILYKRGWQWIQYDRSRAWWQPIPVKTYSGPRPVTNLFASNMNAFCAVLCRIEPTLTFRPATDEPEDIATAEVSDRVIEVCEDETDVRNERQVLGQWVGYTGVGWLENGYDPSPEHGMRLQQDDQCLACGATGPPQPTPECAVCQGPTQPAVDETGQPQGVEVPIGKQYTEVATIFEMYFDAGKTTWKKGVREYIRKKASTADDLERRWGKDATQGLSPDMGSSPGDSYSEQLAQLPGYSPETGPGAGTLQRPSGTAQRISEGFYWSLPTPDYPDGLLAVVLGGTSVVYLGPLPYQYDDGKPFLPTVYFPIDPVPGSLYSKTPADDLALKQWQRNKHEAHMEMTMNRMAWPIWLVPEGANVATFTGEPGQVLKYSALGANGAKPERVQGAGLPNGAITRLQVIDHEMEEITATYAGTKGDHPSGVSAGISLQMIEDRKNNRFGPLYILWEAAWAEWARQQLAIFKQFATEPRLLKIQGRGSQWRIQKFMGSDLSGRIDVVAEAGSGAPRTTLVQRAETEQLFATGLLNAADPEVQMKALEEYGRSSWLPSMKADAENAAKQIEIFESLALDPQVVQFLGGLLQQAAQMQMTQNKAVADAQAAGMAPQALPPPIPPVTYDQIVQAAAAQGLELPEVRPLLDGHAILARELGNWLKGDASQQLPKPIQKVAELKFNEHMMIAQENAMRQAQMRAGTYPTSGFLSNPGGQQGPSGQEQPPSRMQGEQREMQDNAA